MGDSGTIEEVQFVCPDCAETISVNESMREALIEHGCVICGASIDEDDFE